tara:strand:+ start:1329 stop:1472 length:144 start_codon:yes stop_codon:yes gene_type:complete
MEYFIIKYFGKIISYLYEKLIEQKLSNIKKSYYLNNYLEKINKKIIK